MAKPKIAVTFNKNINGPVVSLRRIVAESGADLIDCDYRKIVSQSSELEEIYSHREKMLDVFQKAKKRAKTFLTDIDGLIVSGNPANVDPRLYGKPLRDEKIDLARAISELALIHVALQRGIPILAICGGLQILNVYLGGTIKNLSEANLRKQGFDNYENITVDANSNLGKIMNPKPISSNPRKNIASTFSSHFQVIGKLGGKKRILDKDNYLKIVARAHDRSGSVEAVEALYGALVLGTQFHPEVAEYGFANHHLPKGVSGTIYKAKNRMTRVRNKRIIEAVIKSAKSFHAKKMLNPQINAEPQYSSENDSINNTNNPEEYIGDKNTDSFCFIENDQSHLQTNMSHKVAKTIKNNITKELVENKIQALQNKKNKIYIDEKISRISIQNIFNEARTNIEPSPKDYDQDNPCFTCFPK